jgi:N-acyl-D-amino-acid deacylase
MLSTAVLSLLLLAPAADAAIDADIVIRGATLYDGTGKPGQKGDLAIKGERIVGVGSFTTAGKPRVIDGNDLVVAPGFIDLHTHSDRPITRPGTNANLNYLRQGVTTIVTGNCGAGPVDVAGYLRKIEQTRAGSNVAHQIPHNDLRRQVMGNANRAPTKEELEKMKALIAQGMKDGAWGMATGLYYTPGSYAKLDELVELSRVVAAHHGFYASHMRDEGPGLLASVTETLEIGRQAGLPVHISHMKAFSRRAWGKAADAIALVEQARGNGQIVTADQYPYIASSTSLAADVIPTQYREGSQKDLIARFDDAEQGPKVRQAIARLLEDAAGGKNLRIAQYAPRKEWQGKDLVTIASEEKKPVLDVVLDIERHGGARIVHFCMQEEEVRLIMKQPWVATASDGSATLPADTVIHPRHYGCFPRKIGRYAIEEKVLPLEQAIRSASGLPADILRLPERGYLKPGYCADVVVFDPQTFRDTAVFDKPHQYATGVRYLFVNGGLTIDDGKFTEKLTGKALRHEEKER